MSDTPAPTGFRRSVVIHGNDGRTLIPLDQIARVVEERGVVCVHLVAGGSVSLSGPSASDMFDQIEAALAGVSEVKP